MNVIKKVAITTIGFVVMGSAINAQSLEDAIKAVNAEQYQKAKSMFNNLVKTQPTPTNYFNFGELYLKLNNPDSAKIVFQKGIDADPKKEFVLNQVGLGTVDLFAKNATAAQAKFDQVLAEKKKKDYLEYIYIGKAYTYEPSRDLVKAFEWFEKAKEFGEKEPRLHIAMGDAFKAEKKNSEAIAEYQRALALKENLLGVEVNVGEIWTQAFNFELSETNLKAVIAKDPNFGPAHRALAENYYRWGSAFPTKRTDLLPKAKDSYSKYLDLTDRSVESQYRYLIFLFNAGDYVSLEKSASDFINQPTFNKEYLLARRFRGYAAVENKNNLVAIEALSAFIKERQIDGGKILADDYLFLGKAYQNEKNDSLAIENYVRGFALDSTNTEVLGTIATAYFSSKKYDQAASYYDKIVKLPKATLKDWFYLGYANYFQYASLVRQNSTDTALLKKTLLDADSAFTYVAVTAKTNVDSYLYLARVEYYLNPAADNEKVKNAFEQLVTITTAKTTELTAADKRNLVEAYSSLGAFYIKNDRVKSKDYFEKALLLEPNNQQIKDALAALKAS
jgi:tetratricopeptide (TPR) repeat protein